MDSWAIKRAGVINFWYYDKQYFSWDEGRLLLRGSNGSGKSVTMQLLLPLLLDGNRSPSRLDPFQGKNRRLDNYLLEEDDPREERTGYLFLEFAKGKETLTIGLGARLSRRTGSTDVWYFVASGRSVPDNMRLTKNEGALGEVCLQIKELRTEIGSDGQVFTAQGEYMNEVNKRLFGFETPDEYKELLDLIIQLRSPKLSKDFKPSVVSEILMESLPPLSNEDLRPLSDSIESMDDQKDELEAKEKSVDALAHILYAYDHYNNLVLFGKAKEYYGSLKKLDDNQKELSALESAFENLEQQKLLNEQSQAVLETEHQILGSKIEELEATTKDERELSLRLGKLELERKDLGLSIKAKQEQETNKKSDIRRHEKKLEDVKSSLEIKLQAIADICRELEDLADHSAFTGDELIQLGFLKNLDSQFDFAGVVDSAALHKQALRRGLGLFDKQEKLSTKKVELENQLAQCDLKLETAARELEKLDSAFETEKQTLLENILAWAEGTRILKLSPETKEALEKDIDKLLYMDDPITVSLYFKDLHGELLQSLNQRIGAEQSRFAQLKATLAETQKKMKELASKKELEPQRSPEVVNNRLWLAEKGIPFTPFYKLLKFKDSLPQAEANAIEEALEQMGILDALVISDQYKSTVLASKDGLRDKYIFQGKSGPGILRRSAKRTELSGVLEVDGTTNFKAFLDNALGAIGYGASTAATRITATGQYELGILSGTSSKTKDSKFIGEAARKRYRESEIAKLQEEINALALEKEACEKLVASLRVDAADLSNEFARVPEARELARISKRMLELDAETSALRLQKDKLEKEITPLVREIQAIRVELVKLQDELDLPLASQAYRDAEDAIDSYREKLSSLHIEHNNYRTTLENISAAEDRIKDLEADLENIIGELMRTEKRLKQNLAEEEGIHETLRIKGYDQIVQAINDHKVRRGEIVKENDELKVRYGKLDSEIERTGKDIGKLNETRRNLLSFSEIYKKVTVNENALGLTDEREADLSDRGAVHDAIKRLQDKRAFPSRSVTDMEVEVQKRLNENLSILEGYYPTTSELFQNIENSSLKVVRLDIRCTYDGQKITIHDLYNRLVTDRDNQRELIKEEDRRLFENVLGQNLASKISDRITECEQWVRKIDSMMTSMDTSSGLALSLAWKSRKAETESEMDSTELVKLLKMDAQLRKDEDFDKLASHFHSRISQARKRMEDKSIPISLHTAIQEMLDYRKWFDFRLYFVKDGRPKRELTNKDFSQFSGGEKAMSMYVPLFCAVGAKYDSAKPTAPRIITLDEAFAGVDDKNISDMFRLMVDFHFNFAVNSQALWGDHETVPALSIYELHRPKDAKYVGAIHYTWNGRERKLAL
ncbi:MAG: TIGR02680 family protein [Clostridiales bacterium]|jgi:uncharacterized protein (TIGR02680 family)|nr:TIGR02680 family protein [Clostridiales bacterium]